jgi:LysR family glycine cleavage system transcriptional activator
VELTVPGKRLAGELSAGFSQIKRAVDAVRATPTNRLRISVEPAFAARWLVPRFGRFTTAHPDIEVDMESSEELRTLGRDTDIAIRFLDSATRKPGGSARKLFAVAGFPVIASDKSFGGSRRRSDQDVLGFRLLHDDDGTIWRRWFAAAGLSGYDKAKHLYFNDYSLTLTATLRGQGVALSAPIYVRSQLRSGRLKRIGRTPVTFGDYWLLQATDRTSTKARTAFLDWFAGETQRIAGKDARSPGDSSKTRD